MGMAPCGLLAQWCDGAGIFGAPGVSPHEGPAVSRCEAVCERRELQAHIEKLKARCAAVSELYQRARDALERTNHASGPYEMDAVTFEQKYPRIG